MKAVFVLVIASLATLLAPTASAETAYCGTIHVPYDPIVEGSVAACRGGGYVCADVFLETFQDVDETACIDRCTVHPACQAWLDVHALAPST